MKKFVTILCMIACIFGLTACGGEEALTEYEQHKTENAKQLAGEMVQYLFAQYMEDGAASSFDGYTAEEVEYMLSNQYNIYVDGNAFVSAVDSFHSAKDSMGTITGIGETTAKIDGNQIVVDVEVTGEKRSGTAEVIFSNDMFLSLESAAMNPSSTTGELMANAGLNTLIGMGTVFAVLILISLIISSFKLISKMQENKAKKAAPEEPTGIDNAVTRIAEQEEAVEEEDDLEIVAVIAAAIAASEGAATTDGFVVRSVRKRR